MLFSRVPLLAAVLAPIFAGSVPAQDGQVLTPHDVATLRAVSGASISPDGKRAAYVLLVPRAAGVDEDGAPWNELHVVDLEDGRSRPFITGKVDVGSVKWTPDGSGIAFLAKRGDDKNNSLYVIPADGGEARRVLAHGAAISAYSFAPDGQRVAFVATEAEDEAKKKLQEKGFKQEIYEEDWRPSRVWIAEVDDDADLDGEEEKPRALPLESSVNQVHWSPCDERILVTTSPTPLVDDEMMRQRVRIVDPASGEILARIQNPGKIGAIAWSPDGKRVALISAADMNDPSAGRLMVCSTEGGEPQDVLPDVEADFSAVAWQNADTLMVLGSRGVWSTFGKVSLQPDAKEKHKQILGENGPILTSFTLSKDGVRAAFVGNSPRHPAELFTMSHGDAGPKRRTDSNRWLADKRFATQEVVSYAARDGVGLEGILVRPLDEEKGRRYPLILCVHGGPEAHESNGWQTGYSKPGQMAAARGIATFYPNYRGSTGRGVAFSKLSQGDPAGKEFDDLVDAVDHLIETGLVDEDKVGVTGGSYGGYATAWCATKYSDRFAAGVMFVGISDKVSKTGTTDIPDEDFYVHTRKRPWEDWQMTLERSPIYHAGECKTPLLVLHGKDDPRVNPGQSREMYRHLKLRSQAPVRLVMYPGEGHGNRKAAGRLDYNLRMMQWMEHYLTGPGGAAPAYEIDYADPGKKKDEAVPASPSAPAAAAGAPGR